MNPRTRRHNSSQYCPIWSVWNDASQEWATVTGFSTEAEAQKLMECIVAACTDAPSGAYKVRIRGEYSLMTRKGDGE
jgi:hypothetical protein